MIDLHCHSTASDGSCTPEELLRRAVEIKLKAIALTDHDTTNGLTEFLSAAEKYPQVEAVPGIELAAEEKTAPVRGYHIVGLYISPKCERMDELLRNVLTWRTERNVLMIEKLAALGIPITTASVQELAGGAVIGRPHIALKLVELGFARDLQQAFDRYLATGKCGYVRRRVPSPTEAIAAIHAAGGVAVWAHPFTHGNYTVTQMHAIAVSLKNCGLDGIEANYPMHTPHQVQNVLKMCSMFDLVPSGGSDYHGAHFRNVCLGTGINGKLMVPDEFLDKIKARLRKI